MVREHIAVVEIGYAAISDEEPAARATLCAKGEHTKRSSGAMEERSQKGQNVSTPWCSPPCRPAARAAASAAGSAQARTRRRLASRRAEHATPRRRPPEQPAPTTSTRTFAEPRHSPPRRPDLVRQHISTSLTASSHTAQHSPADAACRATRSPSLLQPASLPGSNLIPGSVSRPVPGSEGRKAGST